MTVGLGVTFTGLRFENPFLLSSAPPTESDSNILRAFDAGWGGVVTKTIGLHPVVNVAGPKTRFLRATPESPHLSMQKRAGTALHSSWNWQLISVVTQAVKEVARVPIWAKLTPSTTDVVIEARAAFEGGADAVVSSNT